MDKGVLSSWAISETNRFWGEKRLPVLQGLWQKASKACNPMNPKDSPRTDPQRDLFRIELQHHVDRRHPDLHRLAAQNPE